MGHLRLMAAVALLATGCAVAPTYDKKVAAPIEAAKRNDIAGALRALDETAKSGDKADLLVHLERGELLRIDGKFPESQAAFEQADVKVNEWENTAKTAPDKLMAQVGATIMGDRFREYEGQDYEKVMLTTRMALNRVSLGDLDTARVDIKRTHEREAVIEEFRAKQTAAAEEEAKSKGVTGTAKELNGYPVETLNDPEVLKLKNGYQNALSHYMAGFVYEALNEPGLAAPGYRKANELRPGLPVLEEALSGLDNRTSFARPRGVTDVLFVIETGTAPARQSKMLTIPIPTRRGMVLAPISFPVIEPNRGAAHIDQLLVSGQPVPAALIADFNVMARRSLKDDLPGIQFRGAIRAIGKAVIQEQLNRQHPLLGLAGNIAAVATEAPADDRLWRFLPERIFVARAFLKPGTHELRLPGLRDAPITVAIDGKHMLVPVRFLESQPYLAQPKHFGVAGTIAAETPPPPKAEAKPAAKSSKPARTSTGSKAPATTKSAAPPADGKGAPAKPAAGTTPAKPAADAKGAPAKPASAAAPAKPATDAKGAPAKPASGATPAKPATDPKSPPAKPAEGTPAR